MKKKPKKGSAAPAKKASEYLTVEAKTPATAVLLLSSPEEDALIKACEAVFAFAEKGDENKVSLLGLGALEPLCQLITHNNKLIKHNAFMALGLMATNDGVRSSLKKINVIPSIIDRLTVDDDKVVQEYATMCLASLSMDYLCKIKIMDYGGLAPLIKLLSCHDPDIQKNATEAIFNLVQHYQCREAVHKLGGIPPLLELIGSDFPLIQQLALDTLQNLTTVQEIRNTFRTEQGFEKLMDFLHRKEFNDLHVNALHIVANCLSDNETVQLMHEQGGLTRLMDFFLTPNLPEVQAIAIKCIGKVAQCSENRKLFHEENVEKVLVELLSVEDIGVKTSVCLAVAVMSLLQSSKQCFRDLGGIPAVVEGLTNEDVQLSEAATRALAILTDNNRPNAFAVYEAGGHEYLVQHLSDSCPQTVANAAATLSNMAKHEVIRCSIVSHGAMSALVEPLKSTDKQVLLNTTLCLAVLATDREARAELLRAGGIQPLVSLLQSYNKEVLHNACMAVNVCASDEPTTVEMCKYGVLELLQEIKQSSNRRDNLSDMAIINVLLYNLPIKYSLIGCLASKDVIRNGFYDAGKARAGQRILTLEELSEQPVNQHRPIIVFNATTENEEDNQKDETQSVSSTDKPWKVMDDLALQGLLKKTKETILPIDDKGEQYVALARLVSEAMGGAVQLKNLHEFPWVLHLSELKFKLQSNVIPIGMITMGIYYHRAFLFKCLADSIAMRCTLVRGEYNRAWNEVFLPSEDPSDSGGTSEQKCYIIDLMHQPGNFLAPNTPAAVKYQFI